MHLLQREMMMHLRNWRKKHQSKESNLVRKKSKLKKSDLQEQSQAAELPIEEITGRFGESQPIGVGLLSKVEIELKDPRLAAFLAWLVPGLGHIYQGRTGKGILFSICILGTFFYGMYIGSGRVVYASTADVFSRKFLSR